jgi:hypothetical protein
LVIATPAYQTAYQLVRPGPIKQVLRRTLTALSAAAMRGRILADTEEVTGSNPVSPTSNTPSQGQLRGEFLARRATGLPPAILGRNGPPAERDCAGDGPPRGSQGADLPVKAARGGGDAPREAADIADH